MTWLEVVEGESPLVVALPHTGVDVPPDIREALNERGQALADTDWHVDRLYADLVPDVTTIRTAIHRYVIDVNRGPEDVSLYPGANTTGLCPRIDFEGQPIYREGREPNAEAQAERLRRYHAPYHEALQQQLDRLRSRHGHVVLYDAHSIRSPLPFLFEGELPNLNVGTFGGRSCHTDLSTGVVDRCRRSGRSWVLNGRFQGGWTTRHYGDPSAGVHALQMELSQITYMMPQAPWEYADASAQELRSVLRSILEFLQTWSPS